MNRMTSTLPHRFRETQFRRFEALMTTVVARFPDRVDVVASTFQMSPETFRCRFRDAMKSLKVNRWSTTVNMDKFDNIFDAIVVAHPIGSPLIVIGDKDTVRDPKAVLDYSQPNRPAESNQLTIDKLHEKTGTFVLLAIAENRKLSEPIRLTGIQEPLLAALREEHDITYDRCDDGSFLLT